MSNTLLQFFSMGGYAFYVWTAYLIFFLVLISNGIISYRNYVRYRQELVRTFTQL